MREVLDDLRQTNRRQYRIAVFGDRGVGKSILCGVVTSEFAKAHAPDVIYVPVSGRSLRFRGFLRDVCDRLVQSARSVLGKTHERWFEELALLANNDQITEGHVETITRRYGTSATVSASLFDVLTGSTSFSWEESRLRSATSGKTQFVTDEILQRAIQKTLEEVDRQRKTVLMFLDDVDQSAEDEREFRPMFKRILELEPCISVVHVRSEMMFRDVRREFDRAFEVPAMDPTALWQMIDQRLEIATAGTSNVKLAFTNSGTREIIDRLGAATGNPFVLLRWLQGFMEVGALPAEDASRPWNDDATLRRVARIAVMVQGTDQELLDRVAAVVDRCGDAKGAASRVDLLRGCRALDPSSRQVGLTEREFSFLDRHGLLIPVDRFDEATDWRLDPTLDLLRPSVRDKLRR